LPSRPREFHPEPLTDSGREPLDSSGSCHRAKAAAFHRLSGSSRCRLTRSHGDDLPPSLHGHYPASSLLRGSPPLSGASVLSASRLAPLVPFPLASPARFSRSAQEPDRASRCLHAGCRSVGIRTSTELIPEDGSAPGFDTI